MKKRLISIMCLFALTACGGGGGGSPTPSPTPPNVVPYPYPTQGNYEPLPDGFESAIPTFATGNTLQIAYGHNNNPAALDLVAYVKMTVGSNLYVCSATPVESDGKGGTWLVGAAHCFLSRKTNLQTVTLNDMLRPPNISINKGFNSSNQQTITSSATIFVPNDYCQGSTFSGLGNCPNFSPANGGQGNDIALIHITAPFNISGTYPHLAPIESYPATYTMAPVLSLGYGLNNVDYGTGIMFYVVNYQYQTSNNTGYYYLYNSYYNPSANGYSSLICGGDSGGGDLFWDGSKWLLLSEHTYGPDGSCGEFYNQLPDGATNVSSYYSWLTNIMHDSAPVTYCRNSGNCVTNG